MARIVTVYEDSPKVHDSAEGYLVPLDMSYIRWLRISEELARLGHAVDMALSDRMVDWRADSWADGAPRAGRVPLSRVRWADYDVVKTLFHRGFATLERHGGADHPCIIAKVGSVVAPEDRDGIHFYGDVRAQLFEKQCRIHATARYVTVLSEPARALWEQCHGPREGLLLVPGGVDRDLPSPGPDPYPATGELRVLFAGNVYTAETQGEANAVLVAKLNALGGELARRGARLYMMGVGDVSRLDQRAVTYLGAIPYQATWDYFRHAQVGVVVCSGPFLHNNESSKIYHYLRVGLPAVAESGFPNNHVIGEANLGFVVKNGRMDLMAERVVEAATARWDRQSAVDYILQNHTWDRRVEVYDRVLGCR